MTVKSSFPEPHDNSQEGPNARLATVWQQFKTVYPTEESCREELLQLLSVDGFIKCHHCGGLMRKEQFASGRSAICGSCKQPTWYTAGTFFHHGKRIRSLMATIYFAEHGVAVSAAKLRELAGIAYATAWSNIMKVSTVVRSEMGDNSQGVSSSFFTSIFCKRSQETPARAHPQVEQQEIEKCLFDSQSDDKAAAGSSPPGHVVCSAETVGEADSGQVADRGSEVEGGVQEGDSQLGGQERQLLDLLAGGDMHIDLLCQSSGQPVGDVGASLMLMEMQGFVIRLAGDRYMRVINGKAEGLAGGAACGVPTGQVAEIVGSVIAFVRRHYQGVSRKYLQNYLALHWCNIDRSRWQPGMLFKACLQSKPVIIDEILKYVTPSSVMVAYCP